MVRFCCTPQRRSEEIQNRNIFLTSIKDLTAYKGAASARDDIHTDQVCVRKKTANINNAFEPWCIVFHPLEDFFFLIGKGVKENKPFDSRVPPPPTGLHFKQMCH